MKKIYTLALVFMSLGAIAQATFYTESFETTSGFSYPNGNGVGTNTQDFFDRTDSAGAPPQEGFNYTGFDGSFFIAGEDIDGAISSSLGQDYLDNINISGKTNLQFTAAFASGTNIDIDGAADSISIEVKIDNGSWVVIGRFRADSSTFTSSSGPFNGQFAEDTNNDGFGDGVRLNGNFTDFSWPIVGSGDSLDVRISMDLHDICHKYESKTTSTMFKTCGSKQKSVFCSLNSEQLVQLEEHRGCEFYKKGEVIIKEGGYSRGLFCKQG